MPPAAALACCLVLAPAAGAQGAENSREPPDLTELSLEELMAIEVETVYAASKRVQNTLEAPSSVTIVTRREIEAQGWRTLADLLRSVRSYYVTDDRNYEHVGVRGFAPPGDYNARVLLLIDGHRANNDVYGSAAVGLEMPLDVDLIERVEIVRGPGSSLYGSNAVFGVIHIVTRRGAEVGGFEVSGEGASFAGRRGRVTWGGALDCGLDLLFSASAFDSAGDDLDYAEYASDPSGGRARGRDWERGGSLFARVAGESLRLEGAWVAREKGIPTGSYGTVFDHRGNQTLDAQGYLDLSGERSLDDDWTLAGRIHYDEFHYRGSYVYDDTANGGPPDLENRDRAQARWWGAGLTLSTTALEGHRITAGAEFRHDLELAQSNRDAFAVYLDDERDGFTSGLFVQDELRLAERWSLNAGLRLDHYDTFGGTLSPRAALIWNPDETSAWKLLCGQAFRAPNAYELYYGDGGSTQKANPDLDPETIRSVELVHERRFGALWRGAATAFWNQIGDLIVLSVDPGDGLLVFRNSDDAIARGIELVVERMFDGGVRCLATYTWQDVVDRTTHRRPPNSPAHLMKLAAEAPLVPEALLAGAELQWMGQRRTLAGRDAAAFAIVNLTLRTPTFANGLSASLSAHNLLDTRYADPGGAEHLQDEIEQDGRTLVARVQWRF